MDAPHEATDTIDLSVRAGTHDDIPSVLRLWREAETVPSATDDSDGLSALLASDPDAFLVAEHRGLIVGTLIAASDGWRGNMYRLAVLPGHRRRGIARSLVHEGERRLRSVGARRVTALVAHELDGAERLWSAVGYAPDPHTTRFVKGLS